MRWLKFREMIGLSPSIHLAECRQCHTLTLPGARECPNCKASFPENYVIHNITAQDVPEERVEAFVSCPGCGRLLNPGVDTCPECGAALTLQDAALSIKANVTVGQAYVVAQRIESFKAAAFIILAISAGLLVLMPVWWKLLLLFPFSIWQLLTIRRWFRWFGSCESGAEEFDTARRKVKSALWLWLAVLTAQASGLAASWLLR